MPIITPTRWVSSLSTYRCINCGGAFIGHIGTSCVNGRNTRFQYDSRHPFDPEDSMPLTDADDDTSTRHFAYCDGCGETITEGDYDQGLYWHCYECESYRCDDCGECEDNGRCSNRAPRDVIHEWDYRPHRWLPKGDYPTHPLLGLELEVGGNTRAIAEAVRSFDDSENHLYMKYDGSISGVEIVTHPATLAWSRNYIWPQLLRALQDQGCDVDDGYGLHVHVSRNAFRRVGKRSVQHQMTWLMFIYRHATQLQQLARRRSNSWASFRTPVPGELKRKAERPDTQDTRYVAVNCNNEKTYELRFFKATLDTSEFMAALEFADASVEYTRGIKAADVLRGQALTWDHFKAWLAKNDYPSLAQQIEALVRPPRRRTATNTRITVPRPGSTSTMGLIDAANYVGDGGTIFHSGIAYEVEMFSCGCCGNLRTPGSRFSTPWDDFNQDGWTPTPLHTTPDYALEQPF